MIVQIARSALLSLVLLAAAVAAPAPQPAAEPADERAAVLAAVAAFFDTMEARDVAGAERVVIPEAAFTSIRELDGREVVRTASLRSYLDALGTTGERWVERMRNPELRIHGPIATVWGPYDFWIDGNWSHCGVDAFDLMKTADGWKIAGGAYTVEKGCAPRPLEPRPPSPPEPRIAPHLE